MFARMKRLLCFLATWLTCLFATAADTAPAAAAPPADWVKRYAAYDEALRRNDLTALEKIYAKESSNVGADGVLTSRTEFFRQIQSGEYRVVECSTSGLQVRRYGRTAVVTCVWKATETINGATVIGTYAYTDTWVRSWGRWQVVASHGTTIKESK